MAAPPGLFGPFPLLQHSITAILLLQINDFHAVVDFGVLG
jgi:hypothetical protein